MSKGKKQTREAFRLAVFERDKYKCVMCGTKGTDETLDAHHITDRNLMLHGGYVKENGITLCAPCHKKAEEFHETMSADKGWYPLDLYARIGSSLKLAQQAEALAEKENRAGKQSMKKRQCTLCDTGTVETDAPKDKAVCSDCARSLMDGVCTHACECPCHAPGANIIHFMACCEGVCPICKTPIRSGQGIAHEDQCHKTLKQLQTGGK